MERVRTVTACGSGTSRCVPDFRFRYLTPLTAQAQINGTRLGASPTNGGANIEMGGSNSDQLIEYVHSFDPRSWSCLHIAEGDFTCNNATIRHNDIGPCGTDTFQQWADGISVSCQNCHVWNNTINNPTVSHLSLFLQALAQQLRMAVSSSSEPQER